MDADLIRRHFPSTIPFPAELAQLCQWHTENGDPISGDFRLDEDEYGFIARWFGSDEDRELQPVEDRFGLFGAGPDGSLYAIWLQDDGRSPIVHMGSEGQKNLVLAANMLDFVRLLAIGYAEIGFSEYYWEPQPEGINPRFQQWVTETFKVTIPVAGAAIIIPAQQEHDDFQAWIDRVLLHGL